VTTVATTTGRLPALAIRRLRQLVAERGLDNAGRHYNKNTSADVVVWRG
jgi:hypothetical protein